MKMKKTILCIMVLFLLCGCTDSSQSAVMTESTVPECETAPLHTEAESSIHSEAADSASDETKINFQDYLNQQNSIYSLREISNDKVMIVKGSEAGYTAYMLNLKDGSETQPVLCDTAPACDAGGFWILKAGTNENGMRIKTEFALDGSKKYIEAIVYDYDMNKKHTWALPDGVSAESFDIETSTLKICYTETQQTADGAWVWSVKITEDDFHSAKTVFEQPANQAKSLGGFFRLGLFGDEVVFKGGFLKKQNTATEPAFGRMSVANGIPEYEYRDDGYDYEVTYFDHGAFIFDAGYPYRVTPSGTCRRICDTKTDVLTLQNAMESLELYPSNSGGCFATVLRGSNEDGSDIIRVTVYSAAGEILKTFDQSFPADGKYTLWKLYVFEESRTVYMHVAKSGTDTLWYSFSF